MLFQFLISNFSFLSISSSEYQLTVLNPFSFYLPFHLFSLTLNSSRTLTPQTFLLVFIFISFKIIMFFIFKYSIFHIFLVITFSFFSLHFQCFWSIIFCLHTFFPLLIFFLSLVSTSTCLFSLPVSLFNYAFFSSFSSASSPLPYSFCFLPSFYKFISTSFSVFFFLP